MKPEEKERLAVELIHNDLISRKLVFALRAAGVEADLYLTHLPTLAFRLLGIPPEDDGTYLGYDELSARAAQIDINRGDHGLLALAREMYAYLTARAALPPNRPCRYTSNFLTGAAPAAATPTIPTTSIFSPESSARTEAPYIRADASYTCPGTPYAPIHTLHLHTGSVHRLRSTVHLHKPVVHLCRSAAHLHTYAVHSCRSLVHLHKPVCQPHPGR